MYICDTTTSPPGRFHAPMRATERARYPFIHRRAVSRDEHLAEAVTVVVMRRRETGPI